MRDKFYIVQREREREREMLVQCARNIVSDFSKALFICIISHKSLLNTSRNVSSKEQENMHFHPNCRHYEVHVVRDGGSILTFGRRMYAQNGDYISLQNIELRRIRGRRDGFYYDPFVTTIRRMKDCKSHTSNTHFKSSTVRKALRIYH